MYVAVGLISSIIKKGVQQPWDINTFHGFNTQHGNGASFCSIIHQSIMLSSSLFPQLHLV